MGPLPNLALIGEREVRAGAPKIKSFVCHHGRHYV